MREVKSSLILKRRIMKMNYLLLILIITSLFSCGSDPLEIALPPMVNIEADSLLIWKAPLHKDTLNAQSIDNIILYQDKIVTSVNPSFGDENETILCFDTSGKIQWKWDDYEAYHNLLNIKDEGVIDNKLYFTTNKQTFLIDINTGSESNRFISEYGSPRITSNGDNMVFKTIKYTSSTPLSDSTSIYVNNLTSNRFEKKFTLLKTEGDAVHIPNVTSYINELGEENLIFQNNTLHMPPDYKEVIDLYSYNLTKEKLNWHIKDISEESWNVNLPQIDEHNIYFATKYRFYSFDKVSGNKNWERLMPHDFQGSNYLLHGDLLITNLDNGDLIAINKNTGETVWHNEGLSACCVKLRIYDDKIYFGNDDIYIVDANNGQLLFRYESSTKQEKGRNNAYFLDAISVDKVNNRIYATDSYYLMSIKHPEL